MSFVGTVDVNYVLAFYVDAEGRIRSWWPCRMPWARTIFKKAKNQNRFAAIVADGRVVARHRP